MTLDLGREGTGTRLDEVPPDRPDVSIHDLLGGRRRRRCKVARPPQFVVFT